MKQLFLYIHHVEKHQAGMLVLVLLRQMNETVLFVEGNSGEIGIDSDVTECGSSLSYVQHLQQSPHKVSPNLPASEIQGYRKTAYLNCGITAKLLVTREIALNLFPPATNYFVLTNFVVKQTEISCYTIFNFKYERFCNTKFKAWLSILKQEFVQVFVTTIECRQLIVFSKRYKAHHLPTPFYFVLCIGNTLFKLPASLSFLFWGSVFYCQPSPFEVESIFTFQYRCLSNRSCHSSLPFFYSLRCKFTKKSREKQEKAKKIMKASRK